MQAALAINAIDSEREGTVGGRRLSLCTFLLSSTQDYLFHPSVRPKALPPCETVI